MLSFLFRRRSPVPGTLHAGVVAAARDARFYTAYRVPDTMDGRFEMLALHLFLLLRRMKAEPTLAELAQEVTDFAFAELDRALRQSGVGDLSVGKRVKLLARRFYGRVVAYEGAVAAGDAAALGATLQRILPIPTEGPAPDFAGLASHVLAVAAHLDKEIGAADLLAGRVSFPAP